MLRFNGIPYAKPPVGPLRWRAPEPPEPWTGTRAAARFGHIAPQVRSAAEVQRAVDDCRYPPQGKRGYGPRVPSNFGRSGGDDYVAAANAGVFAAVMIETREAVEAIDDIYAIPGLDSIVLGPYDLSGSLGLLGQVEHPTV